MGRRRGALCAGHLPQVVLATLLVSVLPGLAAGTLQATGFVDSWIVTAGLAVALSLAVGAAGSVWWARRPASRDVVFSDLMLWGWLRRRRVERRVASTWWLLGHPDDLDAARHTELLERLSNALEARDSYTHGHSRRVSRHAHGIARQLGLPADEAARIRAAAAVHDVGKMDTPREILNKPARLTDEEFDVIKRHPVDGARMVEGLGDEELTSIVLHHHERLDGGGYPDGLGGDEIPVGARVIAVADTFDALTSSRSYRSGCSHKRALDILRAEAGQQLDPAAVDAFLDYYSGRRILPWWSAISAAPSRLTSWLVSGLEGAAVAPLGGGAAALSAAFLVGATLLGSLAPGQLAGGAEASEADAAAAVGSGGAASGAAGGAVPGARGGVGPGGVGQFGGRGGSGRGNGGDQGGGPGGGAVPDVPPGRTPETPSRTPDAPPVRPPGGGSVDPPVERPDVPPIRTPDLPPIRTPDLPPIRTPDLPPIRTPDLPPIRTPDLPRLEVPDLPPVNVPDLPPVQVPDLPPIQLPDLPGIGLPGG